MNIRSVDLNLLAAFDALFDERSVSRAADRLALAQPTVSGMLKRLRHVFDDQLFVRTSHGILPTPRAESLATPIKELLAKAQAIIEPEVFDPATSETVIRICGTDYLQLTVLAPLITRLRMIAPKIQIAVVPGQQAGLSDLLARGEIDLNVSTKGTAIPGFPERKLFSDHYVCVARRLHPLDNNISLQELCAFDHVLVHPILGRFTGLMDEALSERGVRRRVALSVPTFTMLFDALDSSDCLAFIPSRLLSSRTDRLKRLLVDVDPQPFDVVANWHPRMNGDAQHKWLRGQLFDTARQD